jgi:RHS repeat-associated protein
LPAVPAASAVSPGASDLTVGQGETIVLPAAASYANVVAMNDAVVRLTGGLYQLGSLEVRNQARLEALAPVEIRVAGRVDFKAKAFVGPAAGTSLTAKDLRIEVSWTNGAPGAPDSDPRAANFDEWDDLRCLVLAPNGTVTLRGKIDARGAFIGRDVEVGQKTRVTYQDGFAGGPSCAPPSCDDGNPCTSDACVAGVCTHTPVPNGAACSDGNACTQTDSCQAGACSGSSPVVCTPLDICHLAGTCDPSTGVCSNPLKPGCTPGLPPDPSAIAPPLDRTVATTLYDQLKFLYQGQIVVQSGVSPATIDPKRVGCLKGEVRDDDGDPLPGVAITIAAHPEYGQTQSRADGKFDLVVNGGEQLAIDFSMSGYLPARRLVQVPWQQCALVSAVMLIPPDPHVTTVTAGAPDYQVARGSVVTDADGTRQGTVVFSPGTTATAVLPCGSSVPLSSLSMRITEFTVGPSGPNRMPVDLPPDSAYTYAVEANADEAVALGAKRIELSQPAAFYVDNFLGFPAGIGVPVGSYQGTCATSCGACGCGEWVASPNGRVISILSVAGGIAALDTDGDGQADDPTALLALGITDGERQTMAGLYSDGASIWRVRLSHLSTWDCNWGFVPPNDAISWISTVVTSSEISVECTEDLGGPTLNPAKQTVCDKEPIAGTPFSLVYQSDRATGNTAANRVVIPLTGATIPASMTRVDLELGYAGKVEKLTFAPAPNLTYDFAWDGRDAFGRELQGLTSLSIRVGYAYGAVYGQVSRFGNTGEGIPLTANRTRGEFVFWGEKDVLVGMRDAKPSGLGGWSLDVHHLYDPTGALFQGDCKTRRVDGMPNMVNTFAGGGSVPADTGVSAKQARFAGPGAVAVAPDGTVYVVDYDPGVCAIFAISPSGVLTRVAGGHGNGFAGDGGPATGATINPYFGHVAIPPSCQGGFYFADYNNHRVRHVDSQGVILTVAGNGATTMLGSREGDDGPATAASVTLPEGLAIGTDGSLYIGTWGRVARVFPDGIIKTIAGAYNPYGWGGLNADGVPALDVEMYPTGVAVAPDGTLYILDTNDYPGHRIRRVKADGIIDTVVGGGPMAPADGVLANAADFGHPNNQLDDFALASDGTLYFVAQGKVWAATPGGTLRKVGGTGILGPTSGNGGPAQLANMHPTFIAVSPDSSILINDYAEIDPYTPGFRYRRISPALAGLGPSQFMASSEDGRQVFTFDGKGRHLQTLDALTGAMRYAFGYDSGGRIASVTDASGSVTTFEHDASGKPTRVVGPFGHTTTIATDTNGYVSSVTNPAGEATAMTYSATQAGLLESRTDAAGNAVQLGYDAEGRLVNAVNAAGGTVQLAPTGTPSDLLVTRSTGLGASSSYQVEATGPSAQRRTHTFADGTRAVQASDFDGAVETTTLPDGTATSTQRAADPRLGVSSVFTGSIAVQSPSGLGFRQSATRAFTLLDPENPLSVETLTDTTIVDPNTGANYVSSYQASDRTFTLRTPAWRQHTMGLDAAGRLASSRRGELLSTGLSYDSKGRLASVTQGDRARVFGYGTDGMLGSVTDPSGNTTALGRDAAGRVTAQTFADGQVAHFGYDGAGRLGSITPPGRSAYVLEHTATGQLARYTAPAVPEGGASRTELVHDADGRLRQVKRADGIAIDLAYDTAGTLRSASFANGTISYTHSPATGQLAGVDGPDGEQLSFAYDGHLPVSETSSGSPSGTVRWGYDSSMQMVWEDVNSQHLISYASDGDGVMTRAGAMTLYPDASGLVAGTSLGSVNDTIGYDGFGSRATYDASYAGASLFSTSCTRDALGRVATRTETVQGEAHLYAYAYDTRGRLTDVTRDGTSSGHYEYDPNGNRTSITTPSGTRTATFDAQDRLRTQGTATFAFGAAGELASKTDSASEEVTRFAHDALGNLRRVELPDGRVIRYLTDAAGRRVAKMIGSSVVRRWLYRDALRPVAELDASGTVVARFVYADKNVGTDAEAALFARLGAPRSRERGGETSTPAYMVRGTQVLRLLTDELGSVRVVVDVSTGQVVQRLDYDEWGAVVSSAGIPVQPFGFAGGMYDEDTKLAHFGARDYDPSTGRWISKESIATAGVLNAYQYAGGDPVNAVDRSGLAPVQAPDDRAILDSICGPGVMGELSCTETRYTVYTERLVAQQGSWIVSPNDPTGQLGAQAIPAGTPRPSGTDLPSFSTGGDTGTQAAGFLGIGQGAAAVNAAPVVSAGSDFTVAMPATGIALNGSVSDDGLPAGYTLEVLWYTKSGPAAQAQFSNPTSASTTVSFPLVGHYLLELAATDGEYVVTSDIAVTVQPAPGAPNEAPVVSASGPALVDMAVGALLVGTATDDGLPLGSVVTTSWSKVSGPGNVTFSAPSELTTGAQFSAAGDYVLQLSATDGDLTGSATVAITVINMNHAPVVNAGLDQTIDPPQMTTALAGSATDDGLPQGASLSYAWSLAGGPAIPTIATPGQATTAVTFQYPGTYLFRLSVSDTDKTGTADVLVTVNAPSGAKPVVALAGIADDDKITGPVQPRGTISEGAWSLQYRLGGRDDVETKWTIIASGTGPVDNAILGTFDPTKLLNGIYTVRLAATTSAGETSTSVAVAVDGRMKVGNFTLSFTDLEVPVSGLPIQLIRTYDSRDKRVGDFGVGWHMSLRDVRVEKSGKTGAYWRQDRDDSGFFPQYCLVPSKSTSVTITFPTGRVYRFAAKSTPQCQMLFPVDASDIAWDCVSEPGNSTISLRANGSTSVFVQGPVPGHVQLLNPSFDIWDPRQFTLTTEDGSVYEIDQDAGVTQVKDRNGNTIDFTPIGVFSSTGKSIAFERDAENRIRKVTDPAGNFMTYEYDVRGDLVAHVDREANRTTFAYAGEHYLQDIFDPLGRRPIRSEYDADNRLVRTIDATGHAVELDHRMSENKEVITDSLGRATIYEYNGNGDILKKTDPLGHVTAYTYDDRGNTLTETDPLGRTTSSTYDAADNLLARTDPLGHTTSTTYNAHKQVVTRTDALGHVTTNLYHSRGMLLRARARIMEVGQCGMEINRDASVFLPHDGYRGSGSSGV